MAALPYKVGIAKSQLNIETFLWFYRPIHFLCELRSYTATIQTYQRNYEVIVTNVFKLSLV